METFEYRPKGVCSQRYIFEIEDNKVKSCKIYGGCAGNLLGISKIIVDMTLDEIIEDFEGTPCGLKRTSCPDQIAQALKSYKAAH